MLFCSKHRSKSSALLLMLFVGLSFATPFATAQQDTSHNSIIDTTAANDTAIVDDFYTIDEAQATFTPVVQSPAQPVQPTEQPAEQKEEVQQPQPDPRNMSPLEVLSNRQFVEYARAVAVNLLRWTYHDQTASRPTMKYDRKFHFGRWINDPNDQTCYNTRARVLIRDSETEVSFKGTNHCVVEKGRWADPYAGDVLQESKQIQIDHMVPLKNAYISGAWEWNFQTRCTYANYMGNKFHLITASGHENMSKGDGTPEKYIPPNQNYRCEYLENWLKIKLIWKLKMARGEVDAIRQAIHDSGCDGRKFKMSSLELKRQRQMIYENRYNCPAR